NAIEVVVQRQSMTVSEQNQPSPVRRQLALAIIKQKKDLAYMCRGCGMCERVCPNNAIRPVRNPDDRKALLSRDNGPIKRGGRTNLNAQRTLDSIIVGRISQMTDPALDSVRHTFDIRAPFGRVLSPRELPLTVSGGKLEMAHRTPPVRWIYPLIFSDMSIGALSTRAWEAVALATAYLNEKCNLPVRMSSGEGGMPVKLLESEYLKYFIIQIASGHFGWNRIIKAMPHMVTDPGGILIKIGQGAKPGDGGLLPEAKVAEHVQAIRGVPKATLSSPPNHQGLYSIEESVQKMHLSLNAAFGFRVPVAVKCAASATSVAVYHNLLRDPYKICGGFFIDGIQGGTGAAAEVSLDHTGHPVVSKIRDCYLSAVRQGLQGQIPLYGGGGIGLTGNAAADAFKMICLGANGVFCGKVLIQLLGCIGNEKGRCNACNTGKCPTGICTQDPRLVKRLDVDRGAQKIVDYVLAFDKELRKLMAPIGNSSLPVGRSDALVSTDKAVADKLGIQYVC
ncbi:MAG: 4Fe-4S binding protein, partial [Schwartzia sp.]|nr:4Fe-4S binding protein [Schwartzia sp. (in: firmicutes)]